MIVPLLILFIYCFIYKKNLIIDIILILISTSIIIIFYWPLTIQFYTPANISVKFTLFVFTPLLLFYVRGKIQKKNQQNDFSLSQFGITLKDITNSCKLGIFLLPIMLLITTVFFFIINNTIESNITLGIFSFIESFTEEFYFRGVLFLFLLNKINPKIIYLTSLSSFILIHPQYITNYFHPFIISTIVQGILTLEIVRRSKNLSGAWLLHGANRFYSIALIPFLF